MRSPVPSLAGPLLALLAAAGPAVAAPGGAGELVWRDLDLPRDFLLDLQEGSVADRCGHPAAALELRDGRLSSAAALYELEPTAGGRARRAVARDEGLRVESVVALPGLELRFDLGPRGWGYLRVLRGDEERVQLEYAREPGAQVERLARAPGELLAEPRGNAVRLLWEPAPEGALFRIERRDLSSRRGEAGRAWAELGVLAASEWVDAGLPYGRVFEYRVARLAPGARADEGGAGGFGSRVRACREPWPDDRLLRVHPGSDVELLGGRLGGERVDLSIEHVNEGGIQVACGDGVELRVLGDSEAAAWTLPDHAEGGYRSTRIYAPVGRALAVRLPEGVYARLRVVSASEGEAELTRQLDLDGGRAFAPPPDPPEVRAAADGAVLFRFADDAAAPSAQRIVEREVPAAEDSEEGARWEVVAVGEPGELELVDRDPGELGLARYRFRQRRAGSPSSPPTPPLATIVGDDGGAGTERLLDAAIADLGSVDFARRRRAHAVVAALGDRAWPRLREALNADDAQLAAAAREVLGRAAREGGAAGEAPPAAALAPVLLLARAEELGLTAPPPPGWTSERAHERALALLGRSPRAPRARALGRDEERWRRVLAQSDPDPGTRLCAALLGGLEPPPPLGLRPYLQGGVRVELEERVGITRRWERIPDASPGARELAAAVRIERPWEAMALLQVLHELEVAGGELEREVAALEGARLALDLVARHEASGDAVFLEAALALARSPAARLRAARSWSELRSARWSEPPPGAVRRLERPDTEALAALLEEQREARDGELLQLVLPAGVYESEEGVTALRVGGKGARLIADGNVVLSFGLSVERDAELVLEGVHVASDRAPAVATYGGTLVLRDCELRSSSICVQASDAIVELERCRLTEPDGVPRGMAGLRAGGRTLVALRDTLIVGSAGAVTGPRMALIERCVLDGGGRSAYDGQRESELWLVDSLLVSSGTALGNVERGVLESGVLTGALAVGKLGAGVRWMPEQVLCTGAPGALETTARLERSLLGR